MWKKGTSFPKNHPHARTKQEPESAFFASLLTRARYLAARVSRRAEERRGGHTHDDKAAAH